MSDAASVLILYSSVDGQTIRICQRLAQQLDAHGNRTRVLAIEQAGAAELAAAGKIVLGASIRYGRHRRNVYDFIHRHQVAIESRPNAFFSVNVVARKPEKNTPQTNPYMQKFLQRSSWQPQQLAVFAGRIDYRKYGFIDRTMIRFIMWLTNGPTERNACVEFTDWQQVNAFARACDAMRCAE